MINKTIFLKVFFNFIVHLLYLRQQVHGNQNFMSGKVQPVSIFSWQGLVLEREHLALRKGSTPFLQTA